MNEIFRIASDAFIHDKLEKEILFVPLRKAEPGIDWVNGEYFVNKPSFVAHDLRLQSAVWIAYLVTSIKSRSPLGCREKQTMQSYMYLLGSSTMFSGAYSQRGCRLQPKCRCSESPCMGGYENMNKRQRSTTIILIT